MNTKLFHATLFAWFQNSARILPWRCSTVKEALNLFQPKQNSIELMKGVAEKRKSYIANNGGRDPYLVVVSEMMLQQTQVDRVLPLFLSFITTWPTVRALAEASLSDVLVAWKGLGYNRRARFLHEMAQTVVNKHGGVFPKTEQELCALPGIGTYTARAVLAFAFGKDVGVIDTNIRRIFSRVRFGTEFDLHESSAKEFELLVDHAVPVGQSDPWNQALMDLGATICTASVPKCAICPVQKICAAQQRAQAQQKTYTDLLTEEKTQQSSQQGKQKKSIPFKQTDRYFRGRIIDTLRIGPVEMEKLWEVIHKHGLSDRVRFGSIIEDLVVEKLIRIQRTTVILG